MFMEMELGFASVFTVKFHSSFETETKVDVKKFLLSYNYGNMLLLDYFYKFLHTPFNTI